jgi:hypothetical protein
MQRLRKVVTGEIIAAALMAGDIKMNRAMISDTIIEATFSGWS